MPRLSHGSTLSLEAARANLRAVRELNASMATPITLATPRDPTDFDYLFPDLQQDDANLLPAGPETIQALIDLGVTMQDKRPTDPALDSDVPAAYTYFGQFVDHDITLEMVSDTFGPPDDPAIFSAAEIVSKLKNMRTGHLDLDSVYADPAPGTGDKMVLGTVTLIGNRPPGKDDHNDLPREGRSTDIKHDRAALIGDGRNDENLVISQLQVAFLRAHNALVDRVQNFESARRILTQLYQWVVIHDFLAERVADRAIVKRILEEGNRFYTPGEDGFFMPLEFSVAAYRFGHTMVRAEYDFNLNFGSAGLELLFTFTALSGEIGGFDTLPENWIIQWENFVDGGANVIRQIDTRLVEPLFQLQGLTGKVLPRPENLSKPNTFGNDRRLAVRNLLRGYKLRIPTGQAVANAMNERVLSAREILSVAANNEQRQILEASGLADRTPLWFYILAEAAYCNNGNRLGPVGSTIVAEVLIELIRRSPDSILALGAEWSPSQLSDQLDMPIRSEFQLSDLLKLAGVL